MLLYLFAPCTPERSLVAVLKPNPGLTIYQHFYCSRLLRPYDSSRMAADEGVHTERTRQVDVRQGLDRTRRRREGDRHVGKRQGRLAFCSSCPFCLSMCPFRK